MNFLAHTFLSFEVEALIVGNYLGDFVKNKEVLEMPTDIAEGVYLHRQIDTFTDQHEMVRKGTRLLHESMGKYAPVVLDIYFDFLLTKNWDYFSDKELEAFAKNAYRALENNQNVMSEKIRLRMSRMVADRWLENYQTYVNLQRIFNFLTRRTSFDSNLGQAPKVLRELESELDAIFKVFFPSLIIFVKEDVFPALTQMGKD